MGPYRNPVCFFVTYLDQQASREEDRMITLGQCDRNGTASLIKNCRKAGDPVVSVHEILFNGKKICRWHSKVYSEVKV
jgi:hypothetical protein